MRNCRPNHHCNRAIVVLLISVLLLSSCAVPPAAKRITAFSSATSMTANSVTAAFDTVEQSYYQTQIQTLIVNYDKNGFNPKSIKPFLTSDDLEVRAKILGGLQEYAQKLSDVVSDQHLTEFDTQTKAFGQALVDLKGNPVLKNIAAGVPDTGLNILTTAVDSLGRWFIDYKRQKNLPTIIGDMQKPVDGICTLFIADIGSRPDDSGRGGHGLRDQLWRQYDSLLQLQDEFIQKSKDKFDPKTKAEEIAKLPLLVAEQKKADNTLKATQDALQKLSETHKALTKAFEKNNPSLEELISQLYAEGQRVKTFYEGLGKK